jgi:hypothetical protein
MSEHFPHLSMLECLRPAPGWRTDAAVISTYSAHLPVLVAALLALGGEVDDAGSGSRVGLVRALTTLRGNVHFILQAGRLTHSQARTSITALLDQFVLQVPWDETAGSAGKSWHAKFMLVRHVPSTKGLPGERWVFMLGSRNLTLDTSWDIGFTLKSGSDHSVEKGMKLQKVGGVADLVANLVALFPEALGPWSSFTSSLRGSVWQVPAGMAVTDLRLMLPGDTARAMPSPPPALQRVVAVSPFLDKGALAELAGWPLPAGGSRRLLLSTRSALSDICLAGGKLDAFDDLLALAEPELGSIHEVVEPTDGEPHFISEAADSTDEALEPDSVGLHAKMIYAEHAAGSTLWLGSPNLTRRAWTRNAECVLRLDSADKTGATTLHDGIEAFLECADTIDPHTLQTAAGEETARQRLAEARNTVAARLYGATQRMGDGMVFVDCHSAPHPDDPDITLYCGRMVATATVWLRGTPKHVFVGRDDPGVESACVRFRLCLEDHAVEWLQLVPFVPTLNLLQRDGQVLSEYLGSKQMLAWIHAVLSGYAGGDEGGAWDAKAHTPTQRGAARVALARLGLPTLEQALRIWLKDRQRLDEVAGILEMRRYNNSDRPMDPEIEERLNQFSASWRILRDVLPRDTP